MSVTKMPLLVTFWGNHIYLTSHSDSHRCLSSGGGAVSRPRRAREPVSVCGSQPLTARPQPSRRLPSRSPAPSVGSRGAARRPWPLALRRDGACAAPGRRAVDAKWPVRSSIPHPDARRIRAACVAWSRAARPRERAGNRGSCAAHPLTGPLCCPPLPHPLRFRVPAIVYRRELRSSPATAHRKNDKARYGDDTA